MVPPAQRRPSARTAAARERSRAAMIDDIVAASRRQLAEVGAARLSLRAVARELGVVSSALYRYFPTKDDLLTELILRGYDELGAQAEAAELRVDRADLRGRLHALFDAVRGWALAHPHEWGLLFGTPVPGYRAPDETRQPAGRVAAVLAAILRDSLAAGGGARVPPRAIDPAAIGSALAFAGQDAPPELVMTGIMAWTWLLGIVSAELWGHLVGSVDDPGAFFHAATAHLAADLGLPLGPSSGEDGPSQWRVEDRR